MDFLRAYWLSCPGASNVLKETSKMEYRSASCLPCYHTIVKEYEIQLKGCAFAVLKRQKWKKQTTKFLLSSKLLSVDCTDSELFCILQLIRPWLNCIPTMNS